MSKVEVNTVDAQCGTTVTIGSAGKTVSVPGNIVKSNALQASDGGNIIDQCGTTVTLGATGDTIALACGASASGFGLSWCSSIKSTAFSAVAGKGYFVNTCGGAFTVTLPATATAGDQISLKDYARTWGEACKAVTLDPQSLKYQGATCDVAYSNSGDSLNITYADVSKGWLPTIESDTTMKQSYSVQYLVVAGGGGGGQPTVAGAYSGGGGGGGGMRLIACKSFTVCKGNTIPVTIGGGGAAGCGAVGVQGASSVFSTITSAGGGYGGYANNAGGPGGSGGGGSYQGNKGCGNDPAVSPAQGFDGGGTGACPSSAGNGGGGALVVGGAATATPAGGAGGNGANIGCNFFGPTSPSYGTPGSNPGRYFSGGGGASGYGAPAPASPGGEGGGGAGGIPSGNGVNGTVNTGGGGGGGRGGTSAPHTGGDGGSGFVAIRYKFQ